MTKDEQWLLDEKYHGNMTPEFLADRERLAKGEPLGYVIGWQPFLGLKIYLDSKPLIPRVETEWWTNELLSEVGAFPRRESRSAREETIPQQENTPLSSRKSPTSRLTFLDLCAGSGAIGCAALKTLPYMEVFFGEIDKKHESTILKNIRENKLDGASPKTSGRGGSRATIRIGDLFEPFGDMQFDVIAANPPYIPSERTISASVADYEPPLALYGGTDGLAVIRRIAAELPKHLTKDGVAWIECDSAHAAQARALFAAQGLTAEIRTDQYDQPRIIVVHPAPAT